MLFGNSKLVSERCKELQLSLRNLTPAGGAESRLINRTQESSSELSFLEADSLPMDIWLHFALRFSLKGG